jgi:hypothetical protein
MFTLGSLLKVTEIGHVLGLLFPRLGLCRNLTKMVWVFFGPLFHKIIWSHWKPGKERQRKSVAPETGKMVKSALQ